MKNFNTNLESKKKHILLLNLNSLIYSKLVFFMTIKFFVNDPLSFIRGTKKIRKQKVSLITSSRFLEKTETKKISYRQLYSQSKLFLFDLTKQVSIELKIVFSSMELSKEPNTT